MIKVVIRLMLVVGAVGMFGGCAATATFIAVDLACSANNANCGEGPASLPQEAAALAFELDKAMYDVVATAFEPKIETPKAESMECAQGMRKVCSAKFGCECE